MILFAFGWHMKAQVSLVGLLTSILAPSMAPCQVATSHHWVRLLTTEGETVDLDTSAAGIPATAPCSLPVGGIRAPGHRCAERPGRGAQIVPQPCDRSGG